MENRSLRKTKAGVVVSSKMNQTAVVKVERVFRHSKYSKVVRTYKKYYAHHELDQLKEGDKVVIMETRPVSKLKRWRVVDVV